MPPKLEKESPTIRLQLMVPSEWIKRLDAWRRKQPSLPNRSEAIRTLLSIVETKK